MEESSLPLGSTCLEFGLCSGIGRYGEYCPAQGDSTVCDRARGTQAGLPDLPEQSFPAAGLRLQAGAGVGCGLSATGSSRSNGD